jgi:hypothetical protein
MSLEKDIHIYLKYIVKSIDLRNEEVSNCCCRKVIPETDICSACKEHCEIIKI